MVRDGSEPSQPLSEALRGGWHLAQRHGAGLLLSALQILLVVRWIGPEAYGLYALGTALAGFVSLVGQGGLPAYLVRKQEASPEELGEAQALLLLFALVLLPLLFPLTYGFAALAHLPPQALPPLLVLAGSGFLRGLGGVAWARLERGLAYPLVAKLELQGQVLSLGLAIPLALLGLGVWAPTLGHLAQHLFLLLALWRVAPVPPRWRRPSWLREGLAFGAKESLSSLLSQTRPTLALAVAHRFLGEEMAGTVALTLKLVDYASLAKGILFRMALPVLGRLQGEPERFRRALEGFSLLSTLASGLPLFLLTALGGLLPLVLRRDWPGLSLFLPTFALGGLALGFALPQVAALWALGRAGAALRYNLLHTALLLALLPLGATSLGPLGYALGNVGSLLAKGILFLPLKSLRLFPHPLAWGWGVSLGLGILQPVIGGPPLGWAALLAWGALTFPQTKAALKRFLSL